MTYNETEASRNYLIRRVDNIRNAKRSEATETFNIYVNQQPKNYKELIDWIKNDKFKLDDKRTKMVDSLVENDDWYDNAFDGIIFTGSGRPADTKGYEAAVKELDKKVTAVKDVINVLPPADGLKALQELEAWVPTGQAS